MKGFEEWAQTEYIKPFEPEEDELIYIECCGCGDAFEVCEEDLYGDEGRYYCGGSPWCCP